MFTSFSCFGLIKLSIGDFMELNKNFSDDVKMGPLVTVGFVSFI